MEVNIENAKKKIKELRQKRIEWDERQKLSPEERKRVESELLKKG